MVTFDAATHTYAFDGEVLPSVTQLLTQAGMIDGRFYTEHGRDIGTAVHACIQLECAKELDEDTVDPQVAPYLAQWRAFKADTGFEVLASEKRVWSNAYSYAGTLDIYGRLHGRYFVIDFKSNQMPKWVDAQVGAYSLAMRERQFAVDSVACLVLKTNRYKLCCFEREVAEAEFMAALSKAKGVAA